MDQNALFRQRIDDYQSKAEEERQWWDRKKESIQEGFMKELDEEKNAPATSTSATATKNVEPAATTTTATGVSDDDGVLVESEIPSVSSGTNSVKKKKKGKK
jgi:translocation protein SEC66